MLARGDATAGAILFVGRDRTGSTGLFERGIGPAGDSALLPVGPRDDERAITEYWTRRRRSDPDLWVVEVDIADAERFVAETMLDD